MARHSRNVPRESLSSLPDAPMERVLGALEEYLHAAEEEPSIGPVLQGRAAEARQAIAVARGEWWQMGLELGALRQRVVQLEGEVGRLERYVGKVAVALDESEWTTGA